MKVVSYTILHYGREWLRWALRSVAGTVDEMVVVYSPHPSHGHSTATPCPESKAELKAIVMEAGAVWYELPAQVKQEGPQRTYALRLLLDYHGADLAVVVDADEVWDPDMLHNAITIASKGTAQEWRVPMQHFYKSVGWVCRDEAMPVRLVKLTGPIHHQEGYIPYDRGFVHHFGYAQSDEIVHYKWLIHGHLPELRPNWFHTKYVGWHPGVGDVHPTNVKYWYPARFDRVQIEHLIGDHPYYALDVLGQGMIQPTLFKDF